MSGGSPLAPAGMGLRCKELSVVYDEGQRSIDALSGVGFDLRPGVAVALLGATGAGKSTLLQALKGLVEPAGGLVELDGLLPDDESYLERRREVGLVFQRPELQLFAATARDDVAFGPRRLGWPEEEVKIAVEVALELVGLAPAEFGARHPYALSGGEQRRLALAGVLAMRPRLLLLDEPFVSLDPAGRRSLGAVLRHLVGSGATLVLATHDVDAAWALCEDRLVLHEGRLAGAGPWSFGAGGEEVLLEHGLELPFLVELWRRLGRAPESAPRTYGAAAEALR